MRSAILGKRRPINRRWWAFSPIATGLGDANNATGIDQPSCRLQVAAGSVPSSPKERDQLQAEPLPAMAEAWIRSKLL